ncbi:hypothetical protein ZHAS_00015957 [Anopheles sinensis]|uniref:Uncharacterized protein n=1 Tax=Anopheles sinensis TaxID=74873 RepID=A0A084WCF5_ANOSI|nr:hypothetical protein ZHAS_00015957 [Anopheles sinensis]
MLMEVSLSADAEFPGPGLARRPSSSASVRVMRYNKLHSKGKEAAAPPPSEPSESAG